MKKKYTIELLPTKGDSVERRVDKGDYFKVKDNPVILQCTEITKDGIMAEFKKGGILGPLKQQDAIRHNFCLCDGDKKIGDISEDAIWLTPTKPGFQFIDESDVEFEYTTNDKRVKFIEPGDEVLTRYAGTDSPWPHEREGVLKEIKPVKKGEGSWDDIYVITNAKEGMGYNYDGKKPIMEYKDIPDYEVKMSDVRFKATPVTICKIKGPCGHFH